MSLDFISHVDSECKGWVWLPGALRCPCGYGLLHRVLFSFNIFSYSDIK
jgi:hypothetical protein